MKKHLDRLTLSFLLCVSIVLFSMPQRGLRAEAAQLGQNSAAAQEDPGKIAAAREALRRIVQERDVMALVCLCDSCEVRESAEPGSAVVDRVASGQTVNILDVETEGEGEWMSVRAKVSYFDGERERQGYIERSYLVSSDERFLAWEDEYGMNPGRNISYAPNGGYSDVEKFPETYRKALTELKDKHPKWTFVPMDTGLDWQTAVDNEIGAKSLVHSSFDDKYKAGSYDNGNWYYATEEILKQYMDPRNGLTEDRIFQFELLTYNDTYHTEEAVESFLNNTFMKSSQNAPGTEMTFAHIFWAIGKEQKVSPFHLAARVYQEQGKGNSPLISGTYPGYEGFYNYFNVKANGKSNQEYIVNGLTYAKEQGWKDAYYSILGGTQVISQGYIKVGQDTLYLQKYNVTSYKTYSHQYMQNISAPASEAESIKKLYAATDSLDNTFVFKIPVYNNMPGEPAERVPLSYDADIALNIPAGYSTDIWIDGVKRPSTLIDGKNVVSAGDCNARSAVVYRYDEAGNPTGMYVWTLEYAVNRYEATEQPQWKDLFSYEGFSIRINEKPGIRCKTGISEAVKRTLKEAGMNGYYLKEYGTLVMNGANTAAYPMVLGGHKVARGMAYGRNAAGGLEDHVCETVNGRQRFSSVLTGLPASQYRDEYAFRPYLVLDKNGSETVIYGPVVAASIYSLAEKVIGVGYYETGSQQDLFLRKIIADAAG